MSRRGIRLIALAAVPALILSACSNSGSSPSAGATGTPAAVPTATQQVIPTQATTPQPKQVVVRWFVGLGSGTQPNQIDAQKKFVDNYNNTNTDGIYINLEIVPNANATDILKTEIAAGNAPDIIGPVGVKGRNGFNGVFLDLATEVTKFKTDLTGFDPALVDFFKQGGDGQVGLPYTIYPGFIFYNKDLFAEQSLPNLPVKVGDKYNGEDWTWDTLTKYAKQLTVDTKGKKSTDAGFDPSKIQNFGIDFQWADGRRVASCFGGGTFVADDGKTAQIPDAYAAAWKWYYNAMWVSHFAPTGKYINSALLNQGTTVSSGHIAMDASWGWAINSFGTVDAAGKSTSKFQHWDMAVMPSYNGKTSSPMDADTFTIVKASKHPDQAYQAMLAIMADKDLMVNYGGLPAKTALQADYLTAAQKDVDARFPGGNPITWDVLNQMMKYPAVPSHESDMPNVNKVITIYTTFYTKLQNTDKLNVDNEIATLKANIQKAFDEVAAK